MKKATQAKSKTTPAAVPHNKKVVVWDPHHLLELTTLARMEESIVKQLREFIERRAVLYAGMDVRDMTEKSRSVRSN
jgi:hypothetical protein